MRMMLASARLFFHHANSIRFANLKIRWSMQDDESETSSLRRIHKPPGHGRKFEVSGSPLRLVKCEGISRSDRDFLEASIPDLQHIVNRDTSQTELDQDRLRWKVYQRVYALARMLLRLGLDLRELNSWSWEDFWEDDPGCAGIINAAREALANKDHRTLKQIHENLRKILIKTIEPAYSLLFTLMSQPLPDAVLDCLSRDGFADDASDGVERGEGLWPRVPARPVLADQEAVIEDAIFEKYLIDGHVIYRLITPEVVSHIIPSPHPRAVTDIPRRLSGLRQDTHRKTDGTKLAGAMRTKRIAERVLQNGVFEMPLYTDGRVRIEEHPISVHLNQE